MELIGLDEGQTAEGERGVGRMAEPEEIFERVRELLQTDLSRDEVQGHGGNGPLRGKHVLVTAGGTREPLDAVRFIGNRSSGTHGRRARRGSSAAAAPM